MPAIAIARKTSHGQLAGYVVSASQASAAPTRDALGWAPLGAMTADELYAAYDPNGKAGKPMDPAARPYWDKAAKDAADKEAATKKALTDIGVAAISTAGNLLTAKYGQQVAPYTQQAQQIFIPQAQSKVPWMWIGIGAGVLAILGVFVATKK